MIFEYSFVNILVTWLLAELLFMLVIRFLVWPSMQARRHPPPYPDKPERCVRRILDNMDSLKSYNFEKFFCGYFRYAERSAIRQDNVKSFLSWVLFCKQRSELTNDEEERVLTQERILYKRYNFELEPGFNPDVQHVSLSYEEVPYIHRPLLIYLLFGLYEGIGAAFYRFHGFRRLNCCGVEYWHCASNDKSRNPVVMFHGITSGLLSYFNLLQRLRDQREVFLVDLDAIKMNSLVFEMPTQQTYCEIVNSILSRHQVEKVHVVGHSFGSITAGWFVRAYPNMVTNLTLMDPVSLVLGLPDVAFSFLYRKPSKYMEYLIYYFAAMEITIAHTLRRHFWWYNNILWLEDLPKHIGIVVGIPGCDEVANADAVFEYSNQVRDQRIALKNALLAKGEQLAGIAKSVGNMEVLMWDKYSHGQCTECPSAIDALVNAMTNVECKCL